ncbi:MAG TPA: hypothetical protein VKB00_01935 [Candidatus Limnocylindrales bacterium]|nr:hypothetical protein [Candidatus Limnocylindrales bacterium]
MALRDEKQEEAARFRWAAEAALDQVDWAIRYLEGIQKRDIAKVLAANRSAIRRRLSDA